MPISTYYEIKFSDMASMGAKGLRIYQTPSHRINAMKRKSVEGVKTFYLLLDRRALSKQISDAEEDSYDSSSS